MRWIDSQRSASALSWQIFCRTRSANTSAPPPGSDARPAVHQLAQHLLVGHAVEIRKERDLDRGEALQMNLGPDALEAAKQLEVVLERQIGMQAVDDVHFGERLIVPRREASPTRLRATSCTSRDRPAAAARTSRTGSSPRRRWSPRCGCCSCNRSDRRAGARARGSPAPPPRADRDARTAARRLRATAARGVRACRQCHRIISVDRIAT